MEKVQPTFWDLLTGHFTDPAWWAEQLPSWLVFTVSVGLIVTVVQTILERRRFRLEREEFEGWKLHVIGYGDSPKGLYFEEVRRFLNSDFELWKFVKSVVSGSCDVKLRSIEPARNVWAFVDRKSRTITVDFEKMPDDHVTQWKGEKPKSRQKPAAVIAGEAA